MSIKSLTTLIKVHKRALDELKRIQVTLEQQKEALIVQSGALGMELEKEIALAAEQAHMGNFFGNFAERIRKKQQEIHTRVMEIHQQLEALNQQLAQQFGELKKLEIARDNRLNQMKKEKDKKETQTLDEISLQQHARKNVT